jgi:hypothetical protein
MLESNHSRIENGWRENSARIFQGFFRKPNECGGPDEWHRLVQIRFPAVALAQARRAKVANGQEPHLD